MLLYCIFSQEKVGFLTLFMPGRVKSTRPVFKSQNIENSEVKQTQIYYARLCTSNQEKNSQTKNKLPKQLVRSVDCWYGVQRVFLNLANKRILSQIF